MPDQVSIGTATFDVVCRWHNLYVVCATEDAANQAAVDHLYLFHRNKSGVVGSTCEIELRSTKHVKQTDFATVAPTGTQLSDWTG